MTCIRRSLFRAGFCVATAFLTACGGATSSGALPPSGRASLTSANAIWIAAWGNVATHASTAPDTPGSEETFRAILKPSVGSRGTIRLHFSNIVGLAPITLGAVHVGQQGVGPAVAAGTDHTVTFGGSGSVTIAAGGTATSDSVPMHFPYGTTLAITEYVSGSWQWLPGRNPGDGLVTSYQNPVGSGNGTADLAGTTFTQTTGSVNVVDRVDVFGNYKETVALVGSSTADGFGSDVNGFDSLIDDIAKRLHAAGHDDISIVDEAIIPNAILTVSETITGLGDLSITQRFQRDVLDLPGIGWVIQYGGDIDLKSSCLPAPTIIAGDQNLIAAAHAANVKIVLPTIPPATYCGQANTSAPPNPPDAPDTGQDAERVRLNGWILSSAPSTVDGVSLQPPGADAVADFSAAVDDPNNSGYMLSQYAYDVSHPNVSGQAVEAATIPVGVF